MNLFAALHRMTPDARAAFLARAPDYIANAAFLAVLKTINVYDPTTIGLACLRLRQFETPEVRSRLVAWIRSSPL